MTLLAARASSAAWPAAAFLVGAAMPAAPSIRSFGLRGFGLLWACLALAPGHVGCARRVIATSFLVGRATMHRHAGCACTFLSPWLCRAAAIAAGCLEYVF
jgi:hypothetical protein